jgi:phosphatidylinositol kinase/protein kinase (PI-3  family)
VRRVVAAFCDVRPHCRCAVDFGFILGADPKIMQPPMKLTREMVEAMGGFNSRHYMRFRLLCCEAYNILRKHANLILNLFALMADANIPAIVRGVGGWGGCFVWA